MFPEDILVCSKPKPKQAITDVPLSLGLQKKVRAAQARRQREFEAVLYHKK
jgi:hypothetical protein